jgi:DNA-binding LytR/AlgR family response regulator
MLKKNILIVEDESIVSKDIQFSLTKLGYHVVGIASNGEKAIDLVTKNQVDLILMDIMLKGDLNGIELAEKIKNQLSIPVIFLTAYADDSTLSKAKITQPYGYIIKPFKEIDIQISIEMALYKHEKEQEIVRERNFLFSLVESQDEVLGFIFIKLGGKQIKIKTIDIFYVEALKDYVVIHLKDEKFTIHTTMKEIESKLGFKEFIRVHRSYIVRLDKIESIEFSNLILENQSRYIPIGGSYRDELSKRIRTI